MRGNEGFSVAELLVVVSLFAIGMATVVTNLRVAENPLHSATNLTESYFKVARAKAISTTSAYLIEQISATELQVRVGTNCDDAPVGAVDTELALELPTSTFIFYAGGPISVCYSARGLADDAFTFFVQDASGGSRSVEVLLGGALRVS